MNLADHLRPLLRDHDCVIIPDFGGLVAEYASARIQPGGRHLLLPPSRQVAFNQALTRNDGLLVDALREHLGLPAAEAREVVRQAVAALHQQLRAEQRTELPGIGVFRQLPGRGLQFTYTGTDCLLPATFGLPELAAHPVRVLDARQAREQHTQLVPRLRSASQGVRWRRVVPGAAIGLLAGVVVASLYLLGLHPEAAPVAVRPYLPHFDAVAATRPAPQQASFGTVPTLRPSANAEPAAELQPQPTEALTAAPVAAAASTQLAPSAPSVLPGPAASQPNARAARPSFVTDAPVTQANDHNVARPQPLHRVAARPAAPVAIAAVPVATARKAAPVAKLVAPAKLAAPAAPSAKAPVAKTAGLAPQRALAPAATTINQRTGRFYVIIAAYSSLSRAEVGRHNLAHAGRPAKVILPPFGSRLYRLSAADYSSQLAASQLAAQLRHDPRFDTGVSVLRY